jgi:uncharacterized protein (DUF2147 family)
MRCILLTLMAVTLFSLPARAADPAGEWRVEDGDAHIKMAVCAGRLWGVVSWEKTPGTDTHNPDPALRNRPTMGLPIVLGMRPTKPDRWEGAIYNAENGKTYQASIALKSPNVLEVEGCVMSGWLCSSEDWARIRPPPEAVGSTSSPNVCLALGIGSPPTRPPGSATGGAGK